VVRTEDVEELDFEVELAVVFGTEVGAGSSAAELDRSIAGFTVFNDLSDRALQRAEMGAGLLCAAKNRPGYGPLGPMLVTPDEVGDPDSLDIAMLVNGETRQHAGTADMIFSVRALVAYWSRVLTFAPGDVLTLGTPSGSAVSAPPGKRRFLQPGDLMEARIERVGSLVNQVVAG
jgi:2-keto-4-pentenoate hydratase/2-oxohepta-3-ene-1,7-dioic acid hydratase in catechol pathway